MSVVTIRDLMTDPELFGTQFGGDSFTAWRALLAGYQGLELHGAEIDAWREITHRKTPTKAHDELWLVVGRRGGKSQAAALLAVERAAFQDYSDRLSPGEVATVAVLAQDRKAARSVFRYITGLINSNPMLKALVVREDKESIELSNRTTIEVTTASFRSTRGYTFAAVIADEIAFWKFSDESANPDSAILAAVRPGLATLQGPLIALSSPYARKGELYEHHKRHFGRDDDPILVAQAPTLTMNPSLPASIVKRAYELDEASARAEYGAEFRFDVEGFVTREVVEACVIPGRHELPPVPGVQFVAFTDPSGGSKDSWTLAITHKDGDCVTLDATRSIKPPFSPAAVVAEYADLLKSYGIRDVTGDRYGGQFPVELFAQHGITYHVADRPRSDLYRDTLPLLNSGRVELLDNPQVVAEFCALERRTARSGKDTIDHPPGQHDDTVNSIAGAIITANGHAKRAGGILLPRRTPRGRRCA